MMNLYNGLVDNQQYLCRAAAFSALLDSWHLASVLQCMVCRLLVLEMHRAMAVRAVAHAMRQLAPRIALQ